MLQSNRYLKRYSDGDTDVIDVIPMVNVSLRNANPAWERRPVFIGVDPKRPRVGQSVATRAGAFEVSELSLCAHEQRGHEIGTAIRGIARM